MLAKATVKIVYNQVPAFYSKLILVENATEWVETCHQSVATQHLCSLFEEQDGDGHVRPSLRVKGRLYVLNRSEGCVLPDPHPCRTESVLQFVVNCCMD